MLFYDYSACRGAVIGVVVFVACAGSTRWARGAFIETIAPDGSGNVDVSGEGSINLSGFTSLGEGFISPEMNPSADLLSTGLTGLDVVGNYTIAVTGPTNFGTGSLVVPNSGTGAAVLFQDSGSFLDLDVALGYPSGTPLGGSDVYDSATLASLGVTPGTYTWSFGSGASADTITIDATNTPTPEPASAALMGLSAALGLLARSRRRLG